MEFYAHHKHSNICFVIGRRKIDFYVFYILDFITKGKALRNFQYIPKVYDCFIDSNVREGSLQFPSFRRGV